MKKNIILFLLLISALSLGGCGLYGGATPSRPATPAAVSSPSQSSSPAQESPVSVKANATGAIDIKNFSFIPASLTVKKGATVTWTNNDSAPHQIKSAAFNSDRLNQGQNFSFTFNETGTFDYSCSIHPSMKGKIIVE